MSRLNLKRYYDIQLISIRHRYEEYLSSGAIPEWRKKAGHHLQVFIQLKYTNIGTNWFRWFFQPVSKKWTFFGFDKSIPHHVQKSFKDTDLNSVLSLFNMKNPTRCNPGTILRSPLTNSRRADSRIVSRVQNVPPIVISIRKIFLSMLLWGVKPVLLKNKYQSSRFQLISLIFKIRRSDSLAYPLSSKTSGLSMLFQQLIFHLSEYQPLILAAGCLLLQPLS